MRDSTVLRQLICDISPDRGKGERCARECLWRGDIVRVCLETCSGGSTGTLGPGALSTACLPAAYDRPAILRLAGDVTGRRVLELGCAAGVLTRQLVDRGASVLALDREPRMADLARQRLDGRGEPSDPELMHILQTQPIFLFIRALLS